MRDEPYALLILAIFLERGFFAINESHHALAIADFSLALQHHQITIQDGIFDHGITPDPEHKKIIPFAVDGIGHFHRQRSRLWNEWHARSHITAERQYPRWY